MLYKYLAIFPVAVFEGPIITITAGFLSSIGQLNFWLAFLVVVMGDLVGDTVYYSIGRFGREKFMLKYGKYFGLNETRVVLVERHFQTHPWKTFLFGKAAHGTGSLILAAAGLSGLPYLKFLGYNIPTTLIKSFVLMLIGYYFGYAHYHIDKYFRYSSFILLGGIILAAIYFLRRAER